jgi:hypothetical protein
LVVFRVMVFAGVAVATERSISFAGVTTPASEGGELLQKPERRSS